MPKKKPIPVTPGVLAFSELIIPVFPTTSMVAVGLLNTGKYEKNEWIVGDCRG
jgi:predicted AlkP superfamily pyrophosphatase or phosphodiesterase